MFFPHGIAILLQLWSGAAASTVQISSQDISTCPSRTVNYLTHKLPQQCLTSSRSTHTSPTIASVNTTPVESSDSSSAETNHFTDNTSKSDVAPPTESTVSEKIETTSTISASLAVTTITTISAVNPSDLALSPDVLDDESPLENSNFLSFEEWKKQNLVKAGQSEHVGRNVNKEQQGSRKRPGADHNSLDALGDDAEIDIDFSGLVPGGPDTGSKSSSGQAVHSEGNSYEEGKLDVKFQSKDAGTTSKERSNYASFDCGASVLKSNPKSKSPTSVLVENKDAYMLNECSASDKFLILELCNDISIDTVVLANFEFFSSIFRHFRVSVSDRYPVKADKWKLLGTYEARNARGVQAFLIENSVIWARYVRIEFLTHYGHEYYCPVSLVRIHGTTMLEEYKHDLDSSMNDDEKEDENTENSDVAEDRLEPEDVDAALVEEVKEKAADQQNFAPPSPSTSTSSAHVTPVYEDVKTRTSSSIIAEIAWSLNPTFQLETILKQKGELPVCHVHETSQNHDADIQPFNTAISSYRSNVSTSIISGDTPVKAFVAPQSAITSVPAEERSRSHSGHTSSDSIISNQRSSSQSSTSTPTTRLSSSSSESPRSGSHSPDQSKPSTNTSTDRARQTQSSTQPQPASPTMQESFFKSVQKRLQMLESNSSLSLQYIEEQSRSLRDAFQKVEKRQLYKTTTFLEQLNATVLNELREFRQQYDQLWQSTVIELEMQREQYQHENQVMHARLGILADELIFQKRISILQMTLIIICLGLVLFSRGIIHNYLELPLVQSVLSKSPSSRRWMNLSGETPNNTPELRRIRSAQQVRASPGILKSHRRLQSDDTSANEGMETHSPIEINSPPTPVSFNGFSDGEQSDFKDDGGFIDNGELEFDPSMIERPSTSPPVLPGSDGPSTPRTLEDFDSEGIDSRLLGSPLPNEYTVGKPQIKIDGLSSPSKHLKWALPE